MDPRPEVTQSALVCLPPPSHLVVQPRVTKPQTEDFTHQVSVFKRINKTEIKISKSISTVKQIQIQYISECIVVRTSKTSKCPNQDITSRQDLIQDVKTSRDAETRALPMSPPITRLI